MELQEGVQLEATRPDLTGADSGSVPMESRAGVQPGATRAGSTEVDGTTGRVEVGGEVAKHGRRVSDSNVYRFYFLN